MDAYTYIIMNPRGHQQWNYCKYRSPNMIRNACGTLVICNKGFTKQQIQLEKHTVSLLINKTNSLFSAVTLKKMQINS